MNKVLIAEDNAEAQTFAPARTGSAIRVFIRSHADILEARKKGRELARALGFSAVDCILITAAISELARNIVVHARDGEIRLRPDALAGETGIEVTAIDRGPGIFDVDGAIRNGRSMTGNLGLGLPGVKRIMDDFEIASKPGQGATVTVRKWKSHLPPPLGPVKTRPATNGAPLPQVNLDE